MSSPCSNLSIVALSFVLPLVNPFLQWVAAKAKMNLKEKYTSKTRINSKKLKREHPSPRNYSANYSSWATGNPQHKLCKSRHKPNHVREEERLQDGHSYIP